MTNSDSKALKLWHCHDARSLRPLWCLEELGLDYQLVELPFPPRYLQKDFLEKNILGTVPYFECGSASMTESVAICQYLVDCYSDGQLSVDRQHADYASYLNFLHQSDATLTFPQTVYLRYAKFSPPELRQPQVADDYRKWFLARLRRLEQHVSEREYLCADKFTIADISVGYALFLARSLGFDSEFSPQLSAYLDRLVSRPAFSKARSLTSLKSPI